MDNKYVEKIIENEQRSKSNMKRLDVLEPKVEDIHELTSSVKVLASEMKAMREDQIKMDDRLKNLEDRPMKKADQIWGYVIAAIISLLIGFVAASIGLK